MKSVGNEDGFTLIEMLVSLFIFSLISAGTMTIMGSTIAVRDRVNQGMDALNRIQASRAIMRTDFERISLRARRDILGSFEPYVLTTDGESLINFTRLGRENPGGLEARGDAERVAYLFRDEKLIRQSWTTANPDVSTKPRETVLFDDLVSARIEFLSEDLIAVTRLAIPVATDSGGASTTSSGSASTLPGVIRFVLTDSRQSVSEYIFEMRG